MTNKCSTAILGYDRVSTGCWDPLYHGTAHMRPLVLHKISTDVACTTVDGLGIWAPVRVRGGTPVRRILGLVQQLTFVLTLDTDRDSNST